ncbi:hypothetical protein [Gordonia sp. KTR9]|uniref:hypothetical protein n=1 Tax=Gordonia sp. KTR9 TaxID=337191 RepID=UPI00027DE52C|nr:hypothetical protein [Gordonia sp. KTR9]AFR51488.1 hypothetical protein KTR9_5029 [Gordonia sp. KTR9]
MLSLAPLVVVATALTGCGGEDGPAAQSSATTPPPTAPPTEVTWTTFGGVKVPCADQGPKDCYGSAPTGFDHTGAGAALAAISATIRMSIANDQAWPSVVGTLVAPSPARDQWSINRVRISITGPVDDDKAPVVEGYTIDAYTPQAATVGIITRQPDQSLTRTTSTVRWSAAGDWLLELPPTDSTTSRVQAIDAAPADMIDLPNPS